MWQRALLASQIVVLATAVYPRCAAGADAAATAQPVGKTIPEMVAHLETIEARMAEIDVAIDEYRQLHGVMFNIRKVTDVKQYGDDETTKLAERIDALETELKELKQQLWERLEKIPEFKEKRDRLVGARDKLPQLSKEKRALMAQSASLKRQIQAARNREANTTAPVPVPPAD